MINWPSIAGVAGYDAAAAPAAKPRQRAPKARATRGAENFSPAMKVHADIPDDEP